MDGRVPEGLGGRRGGERQRERVTLFPAGAPQPIPPSPRKPRFTSTILASMAHFCVRQKADATELVCGVTQAERLQPSSFIQTSQPTGGSRRGRRAWEEGSWAEPSAATKRERSSACGGVNSTQIALVVLAAGNRSHSRLEPLRAFCTSSHSVIPGNRTRKPPGCWRPGTCCGNSVIPAHIS